MSLFSRKPQESANITYISHSGDTHTIAVPIGDSVMEGAVKNGIDGIVAECGGSCMCATCHVYVEPEFLDRLNPMDETEAEMLNATVAERKSNSRLSCQLSVTKALDGLVVRMPETQQ
jgi:2Fe-2S ferredoxin